MAEHIQFDITADIACFVRPMKSISIDIEKLYRRFNRNQNVVRRLKGDTKHLVFLPKRFMK